MEKLSSKERAAKIQQLRQLCAMFTHSEVQAESQEVSFSAFIQHFSSHKSAYDEKGCLDINRSDDRLRTHLHRAVIKNRYGVVEGLM